MECFLLGSGGMMPMPGRRLTSVAVRNEGQIYLLDCGEGTQVPYKEKHLGLRNLNLVAITHLHADHVLGLPGMMMLRGQMPDPTPLTVLGTPGTRRFIQHVRSDLGMRIDYPVRVIEWSPSGDDLAFEDEHVRITWQPLDHRTPCVGYRLEEKERPGRFDPEAAQRLGVPRGPLWGQLQAGKSVQGADGIVEPSQVLGPQRRGRSVAFCTDTAPHPNMQPLLRNADLAFIEGMFAPEEEQDAAEKKHMTILQSIAAAKQAEVQRLVIVHISPRYENEAVRRLDRVAKKHHPAVEMARDGREYEISLPD